MSELLELPVSPELSQIDQEFNLHGQQIQHREQELAQLREERLRLQGRWAQREADEVEITALRTALAALESEQAELEETVAALTTAQGVLLSNAVEAAEENAALRRQLEQLQAQLDALPATAPTVSPDVTPAESAPLSTRPGTARRHTPSPAADAAQEQSHG